MEIHEPVLLSYLSIRGIWSDLASAKCETIEVERSVNSGDLRPNVLRCYVDVRYRRERHVRSLWHLVCSLPYVCVMEDLRAKPFSAHVSSGCSAYHNLTDGKCWIIHNGQVFNNREPWRNRRHVSTLRHLKKETKLLTFRSPKMDDANFGLHFCTVMMYFLCKTSCVIAVLQFISWSGTKLFVFFLFLQPFSRAESCAISFGSCAFPSRSLMEMSSTNHTTTIACINIQIIPILTCSLRTWFLTVAFSSPYSRAQLQPQQPQPPLARY